MKTSQRIMYEWTCKTIQFELLLFFSPHILRASLYKYAIFLSDQ